MPFGQFIRSGRIPKKSEIFFLVLMLQKKLCCQKNIIQTLNFAQPFFFINVLKPGTSLSEPGQRG